MNQCQHEDCQNEAIAYYYVFWNQRVGARPQARCKYHKFPERVQISEDAYMVLTVILS
jgi:hypothetical protein